MISAMAKLRLAIRFLLWSRKLMKAPIPAPAVVERRVASQGAAIILVHGFTGTSTETWGNFPALLMDIPALNGWDVISLGYSTRLAPDLSGIWSADAPIDKLATLLRTTIAYGLAPYKTTCILAHSMGGLVVQRALVDDPSFAAKVSHLFLFGTPSDGLAKASPIGFLKRQLRDMKKEGIFITDLRSKWTQAFGVSLPFSFWTVAGERDEFVPSTSSLGVFPANNRAVIPGNHLEIVKPESVDHLGVQLVVRTILKDAAPAGPWNSANVAIEGHEFRKAIQLLEPHAGQLDETGLVQLALAYESVGRTQDAIKLLEDHGADQTDAMGTLAGRLKRRWLVERRKEDYDRALKLYSDATRSAVDKAQPDQVYYHAVNVAFLQLAAGHRVEALETARKVLEYANYGDLAQWKLATRGEAFLILGDVDRAIESYKQAIAATSIVREIESMYKQAVWIIELRHNQSAVPLLNNIFRPNIENGV